MSTPRQQLCMPGDEVDRVTEELKTKESVSVTFTDGDVRDFFMERGVLYCRGLGVPTKRVVKLDDIDPSNWTPLSAKGMLVTALTRSGVSPSDAVRLACTILDA